MVSPRAPPQAGRPWFLGQPGLEGMADRLHSRRPRDLVASWVSSVDGVTLGCVEVTESLLAGVPVGNLRVPRAEFSALWAEAERLDREQTGESGDWYPAAVAVTCRWLAGAIVQDQMGRRAPAPAPATRRRARAYEELIEAEYLAAEQLDVRRPDLVGRRPGWCEGIRATLRWVWRCEGPHPFAVTRTG